jgi:hypothetical protein
VYKRQFERLLDDYGLTNTHATTVVGRANMCVVHMHSRIQNTSIIEAFSNTLTAYKQSILEPGCINVNLSDFFVPIA